jgi:hypothetical protein
MDTKGYGNIPQSLYNAITFLAQALPKRSVPTFLELLFGAMLTQNGFVTEAWLAIKPRRHWTSYFKWLQKGRWSWVALGLQTARLALQRTERSRCYVAIDDTVSLCPGTELGHLGSGVTARMAFPGLADSFPVIQKYRQ